LLLRKIEVTSEKDSPNRSTYVTLESDINRPTEQTDRQTRPAAGELSLLARHRLVTATVAIVRVTAIFRWLNARLRETEKGRDENNCGDSNRAAARSVSRVFN